MNQISRHISLALGLGSLIVLSSQCVTGSAPLEPTGDPVAIVTLLNEETVLEVGDIVYLDGSESQLGENSEGLDLTLSYHWDIASRPIDSLIVGEDLIQLEDDAGDEDPARISLTPDVQGLYGITLQVGDGERVSDVAHITLEIGGGNNCPVADAGADVIAQTGVPVTLDGSASSDEDIPTGDDDDDDGEGDLQEMDHAWQFSLVPSDSSLGNSDIFHQGTASPTFIPDVPGTYILQLRVDDGLCTSLPDYVTIQASNGNQTPVADAGSSRVLTPCSPTEITLDGTGSYDPEGAQLLFEWNFTAVPNGSAVEDAYIDGRFSETPKFNWDIPGIYALQLVVSDGVLTSEPDYIAVQAVPPLPNGSPVASAGDDILLDVSANCTNDPYGGGSCTPCSARNVVLSGAGSSDPDGDPLNYQWDHISGNATLIGVESIEVDVELPELPVNYGGVSSTSVEIGLTVFDCRAADDAMVTITYVCNG